MNLETATSKVSFNCSTNTPKNTLIFKHLVDVNQIFSQNNTDFCLELPCATILFLIRVYSDKQLYFVDSC